MTDNKEKKFVISEVFTDLKNVRYNDAIYGTEKRHFGIPWSIYLLKYADGCFVEFKCHKSRGREFWSIDTSIEVKILTISGEEVLMKNTKMFSDDIVTFVDLKNKFDHNKYLVDGNLTIECHVTINRTEGIRFDKLRDFSDETMKKLSDVVLVVDDQKFYYLVVHSTYFESLFLGNFDESKQSEVELKDIDPSDFQNFLEVIYGEPAIDDENVEELLKLADMYDTKTVIRQCEEFLIHKSKKDMKVKFEVAVKYKMEKLMVECISEIKTIGDIEKLMPVESTDFHSKTLSKLLTLSIDLYKKK